MVVGEGGNSIAYSDNGTTWNGVGKSVFSDYGFGIAWNGSLWVATGVGGNTLAYSSDGISWTGLGLGIFSIIGRAVTWNGTRWVAGGEGGNSLAYSSDGITWTGIGTTIFTSQVRGIGWNGSPINSGEYITLDKYGSGGSDTLDIVSSSYYNQGFSNLSIVIKP